MAGTLKVGGVTLATHSDSTGLVSLSNTVYPAGSTTPISIAIVSDKKPSGTSGGGYTADTWTSRTLDDEEFDPDNIVTLANNQFTLISGKYYVKYFTTAFYCNSAFSRKSA